MTGYRYFPSRIDATRLRKLNDFELFKSRRGLRGSSMFGQRQPNNLVSSVRFREGKEKKARAISHTVADINTGQLRFSGCDFFFPIGILVAS